MKYLLALFALPLLAQTQFYVPTGTTRCIAAATNATPIVITTAGCDNTSLAAASPTAVAHGWANDTVIVIAGVEGNTAANGTRVVKNVTSTTAELYTVGGSPVAGNGVFLRYLGGSLSAGASYGATSYPEAAVGTLVTLRDHPRVWLDGSSGSLTSSLCGGSAPCKGVSTNPAYAAMKTTVDTYAIIENASTPTAANLIYKTDNSDAGILGGVGLVAQVTGSSTYRDWTVTALNNIDKYIGGFSCLEQIAGCGDRVGMDYQSKRSWNIAQMYSIVRFAMTSGERATFAGKMLNGSTVGESCTNRYYAGTGTIARSGTAVTGAGTQWLTNADTAQRIAVGDTILFTAGCTAGATGCDGTTRIVAAVNSDTSLTLQTSPGNSDIGPVTAGAFWIGKPWASGNCGLINYVNHSGYSPLASGKAFGSGYVSGVPTTFGGDAVYARDELTRVELNNQILTKGLGALSLAIALADDDPRAIDLIQHLMFWWKDYWYPLTRSWTTGAMQVVRKYYDTRMYPFTVDFAVQLRNSFVEPVMDFTGGNWLKAPLSFSVYGYNRAANSATRWGVGFPADMTADRWKGSLGSMYLDPTTDEARAMLHILQMYTGQWGPSTAQFGYSSLLGYPDNFIYYDPAWTATSPNGLLPLAKNLTISDSQPNGEGTGVVISRTGWLTDSSILEVHANSQKSYSYLWLSPSYTSNAGSYKIFKRYYLLAEDQGKGIQQTFTGYGAPNEQSNFMHIGPFGATSATLMKRAHGSATYQYVTTPRFWNDASNAATYAMVDYAGAYQSTAQITFAHRHFAHFKKAGASEYVIAADAVRTSGGQAKVTFLHYPNNGQQSYQDNGTVVNPAVPTEGTTSIAGDLITSSSPTSRILTRVLRPNGSNSLRVYTDNVDGSYTGTSTTDPARGPLGGQGQTFRVSVCASTDGTTCDASNLKTNILVTHRVVDGTTETLNPGVLISTIDPNFVGAQIDDGTTAVVAVFPSEGSTLSSATFTTTHSTATGQYLVSGLTAGTWSLSRDGSIVSSSLAVDSSGVAYWEGAAGAYSLARTGAGALAVTTTTVPNATPGGAYSVPLAATGGTPPYTWDVSAGALPSGITLSSGGLLSGSTSSTGTFSFTARVTDSVSAAATQALSLTVAAPTLSVVTSSLASGATGAAYSATLTATGGIPSYTWSIVSGTLCTGLSLSGATISGTPSATGTCSFRVQVTDFASATATKDLTITISGTAPLSITTASLAGGTVDSAYSAALAASGGTSPYTWAVTGGALPAGLSLSSGGSITGTPTVDGILSMTFTATDAASATASKTLTITISAAPTGAISASAIAARSSVIVRYSGAALPGYQTCSVTLSQGGSTIATAYDAGGRQSRLTSFGSLPAGTYDYVASCGAVGQASGTVTVAAATGATGNVIAKGNVRAETGAAKMRVEWGYTAAMSETPVVSTCSGACTATLPSVATGAVIWTRISYLTSGDTVVASGAAVPLVP